AHSAITRRARSRYSAGGKSFSRSRMPAHPAAAMRSSRRRKSPRHRARLVTHRMSDIEIVVEHRLQPLGGHGVIHGLEAAPVADLELLVPLALVRLGAGILALMIADAGGNAGGD